MATFYEPPQADRILTYIEVATDVEYDRATGVVSAIDMDLDVIKSDEGRGVWIDDEDEFEERIVSMAYPAVSPAKNSRRSVDSTSGRSSDA